MCFSFWRSHFSGFPHDFLFFWRPRGHFESGAYTHLKILKQRKRLGVKSGANKAYNLPSWWPGTPNHPFLISFVTFIAKVGVWVDGTGAWIEMAIFRTRRFRGSGFPTGAHPILCPKWHSCYSDCRCGRGQCWPVIFNGGIHPVLVYIGAQNNGLTNLFAHSWLQWICIRGDQVQ